VPKETAVIPLSDGVFLFRINGKIDEYLIYELGNMQSIAK
jgi:hypothetical protein